LLITLDHFGAPVRRGDYDLGDVPLGAKRQRYPATAVGRLPSAALSSLAGDETPLDIVVFGHYPHYIMNGSRGVRTQSATD
jgi:hypothetical protein